MCNFTVIIEDICVFLATIDNHLLCLLYLYFGQFDGAYYLCVCVGEYRGNDIDSSDEFPLWKEVGLVNFLPLFYNGSGDWVVI